MGREDHKRKHLKAKDWRQKDEQESTEKQETLDNAYILDAFTN